MKRMLFAAVTFIGASSFAVAQTQKTAQSSEQQVVQVTKAYFQSVMQSGVKVIDRSKTSVQDDIRADMLASVREFFSPGVIRNTRVLEVGIKGNNARVKGRLWVTFTGQKGKVFTFKHSLNKNKKVVGGWELNNYSYN